MQIVSDKYTYIIEQTKEVLTDLLVHVKSNSQEDLKIKLNSAIENLENLFMIVFMGEFSTGKSSIINALIGENILEQGITPTTDKITIIKFGELKEEKFENGVLNITVPNKRLENTYLVDTPGTNVTIEQHERITKEFIPRADIVFFTIGAERAVTGSESDFIKFLKDDWSKNIVFLLNKIDVAQNEEELNNLLAHVSTELKKLFGIEPFIIPISAKRALENNSKEASGFNTLNEYLFNTLSQDERIKIKLKSSINLSLSLADETLKSVDENLEEIDIDLDKLKDFEGKISGMKADVISNSGQFTERIKGRLLEFKNRGVEFIDGLIRFENIFKLFRKEKVAKEFEQEVSLQTVKELEKDLEGLVEWTEKSSRNMVDNALSFYRDSIEREKSGLNSPFMQNRMELIDTVRSELELKKKEIDPKVLGSNLVDSARTAVASVLGVQVGSLALGATVVSAFSSFIVDITGILTTIAVMATAFAILPKKRSNAMKEFSSKVDNLSKELVQSINSQLNRDLDNVEMQIVDSLSPLRNFYKTEKQKKLESKQEIIKIKEKLDQIQGTI